MTKYVYVISKSNPNGNVCFDDWWFGTSLFCLWSTVRKSTCSSSGPVTFEKKTWPRWLRNRDFRSSCNDHPLTENFKKTKTCYRTRCFLGSLSCDFRNFTRWPEVYVTKIKSKLYSPGIPTNPNNVGHAIPFQISCDTFSRVISLAVLSDLPYMVTSTTIK